MDTTEGRKRKMKKRSILVALLLACSCMLAACGTDTQPQATPTPTPDQSWKQLYEDFFAQNLILSSHASSSTKAYELQSGDLLEMEEDARKNMNWVEAFALCDLNFDGMPELILNNGQVEREMYVFAPLDGKVTLVSQCLSGNQEYTDMAVLYQEKQTGEKAWYSESLSGTGAGSLYEFGRLSPQDFSYTVLRSYLTEYDVQAQTYVPVYRLDGQTVDHATYQQEEESFAQTHEQLAIRSFIDMGDDPLAALQNAMEGYVAP